MTAAEAVAVARKLFPNAFRVYAYAPCTTAQPKADGTPSVQQHPAMVYVQTVKIPPGGWIMNQPCGYGPTFEAALSALCRCPITEADDATREAVLASLGGSDPMDGGFVGYHCEGNVPVVGES